MKSTLHDQYDYPIAPLPLGDVALKSDLADGSQILFSIPAFPTGESTGDAPRQDTPNVEPLRPATVVPLSVPEANFVQSSIHATKQKFIELASGSIFWRFFVGSGIAISIAAMTLILIGPNPDQLQSEEIVGTGVELSPDDQSAWTDVKGEKVPADKSSVQLTVSTSDQGGAEPASFDDPFTAANQVPPRVAQAVHFDDPLDASGQISIQPVSHAAHRAGQPVWLSGTIEFDDN